MRKIPLKNIAYEFVLTSPIMPSMSWFARWEVSSRSTAVLLGAASRIYSKQPIASLCEVPLKVFSSSFVKLFRLAHVEIDFS